MCIEQSGTCTVRIAQLGDAAGPITNDLKFLQLLSRALSTKGYSSLKTRVKKNNGIPLLRSGIYDYFAIELFRVRRSAVISNVDHSAGNNLIRFSSQLSIFVIRSSKLITAIVLWLVMPMSLYHPYDVL